MKKRNFKIKATIRFLNSYGMTQQQMATHLGITQGGINYHLKNMGLTKTNSRSIVLKDPQPS